MADMSSSEESSNCAAVANTERHSSNKGTFFLQEHSFKANAKARFAFVVTSSVDYAIVEETMVQNFCNLK